MTEQLFSMNKTLTDIHIRFLELLLKNKVDFITGLEGLIFDNSIKRVKAFSVSGMSLPVLDLSDLVINKMSTTRLKDKLDVEELQKIQRLQEKQD